MLQARAGSSDPTDRALAPCRFRPDDRNWGAREVRVVAIRQIMPRAAASLVIALASCCVADAVSGNDGVVPANTQPFQAVRPARFRRNAEEAGYFRPLAQPRKTQAALEHVVEFDVDDMPMEDFFAGLEETTGVRFLFDATGLEEAALTSDAEITCRSAGMPLHVAIGLLLRDLDCACVIEDEYVLITSRETADLIRETRLYALVDHPLLREADADRLAATIAMHADQAAWGGFQDTKVDLLPGALAISGYRESAPKAESLLRQYARLLAEYDAAPSATASRASSSPGSTKSHPLITVSEATVARDPSGYFRSANRPSKAMLALEKPADFDVVDVPMNRFFIDRERVLGVPFRLDVQGLQAVLVEPDTELTFRASGLRHATALSLMLQDFDLKLVPYDDYILITSADDDRFQVAKRTYEVAGHPLLTKDGGDAFLKSLRRHIAWEGMDYPAEYGLRVRQGKLTVSADDGMLEQADAFLKQYARLLAEYDAVGSRPASLRAVARVGKANAGDCFRPLWYRPRTHLALERRATIDLQDVPLDKFFADLERTLGISFDLDDVGLEEAAITSDAEVTFRATGMSYADALSQMLEELDLAFVAKDDFVSITSREAAALERETRIYAVLDHPRLRAEELETLVATIGGRLGDDDSRNDRCLIHLLPGALVISGSRQALALAEERLGTYGLAAAEYAPERPANSKPLLKFRLPPRAARATPPPAWDPFPIRPEDDPFAGPRAADPFGNAAPDPFAKPPVDPFAPSAGSGR
jgi:hypothetical protein